MKEWSILTPINQAVVVLLVGFGSVTLLLEKDICNSLRATRRIVVKSDVLERSDGRVEQFLDLSFIHVRWKVGHDNLLRSLRRRGSGFTSCRCGGGIPDASCARLPHPKEFGCASTTTAAGLSRWLGARGNNIIERLVHDD